MLTIGGSVLLGNYVIAFVGVTVLMFGPVFALAVVEDRKARPARVRLWDRPLVASAGRWLLKHSGGRHQVIRFDWRYLDADGQDVTERMHTGTVEAATAEAWQAGEQRSQLLLRVARHGAVWRIAPQGGLLGGQVYDATVWLRPHADPWAAMAAVARHLKFTALETA